MSRFIVAATLILASLALAPTAMEARDDEESGVAKSNAATATASKLANPKGSCLKLNDLKDAVIENLVIGPCGDHGIELHNSHNVTIRNVVIKDTTQCGIYITGSTAIEVSESRISDPISGIYVVDSSGIKVSCNTVTNPRGPIPRGQFIQFDKVTGANNRISCNSGRNEQGRGTPEDAISLYKSSGTAQSPLVVADNLIVGGGPSVSGGGIMLGDDGGAYEVAERNVLVDPGQYGIGVASGNNMTVRDNSIYGRKQDFTNVGIYVWNQYPHACRSISVQNNQVKYTSKTGRPNPFWDGENCGVVEGAGNDVAGNNDFNANLTAELAQTKSPNCACRSEGWR